MYVHAWLNAESAASRRLARPLLQLDLCLSASLDHHALLFEKPSSLHFIDIKPPACRALERIFAKASDDKRLQQWDAIPSHVTKELSLMPWWKVKALGLVHKPRVFGTSLHQP